MEWTDYILRNFRDPLNQAGIYEVVGVSSLPYHISPNTWRALCELWGPLTNTLHHGNGGLPISGTPYEEFIPTNKELRRNGAYPSTVAELLRIHSELCESLGKKYVTWENWLAHFYRGKIMFSTSGHKKRESWMQQKKTSLGLEISKEGELAAFLSFWLSRSVLKPFTWPVYLRVVLECPLHHLS